MARNVFAHQHGVAGAIQNMRHPGTSIDPKSRLDRVEIPDEHRNPTVRVAKFQLQVIDSRSGEERQIIAFADGEGSSVPVRKTVPSGNSCVLKCPQAPRRSPIHHWGTSILVTPWR